MCHLFRLGAFASSYVCKFIFTVHLLQEKKEEKSNVRFRNTHTHTKCVTLTIMHTFIRTYTRPLILIMFASNESS